MNDCFFKKNCISISGIEVCALQYFCMSFSYVKMKKEKKISIVCLFFFHITL